MIDDCGSFLLRLPPPDRGAALIELGNMPQPSKDTVRRVPRHQVTRRFDSVLPTTAARTGTVCDARALFLAFFGVFLYPCWWSKTTVKARRKTGGSQNRSGRSGKIADVPSKVLAPRPQAVLAFDT